MNGHQIKVLDILEDSGFGGTNTNILRLVSIGRTIDEIEWNLYVLSNQPKGWVFDKAASMGIPLIWIPCRKPFDWYVPFRISKIVREKAIDIIHTHGYRANFYVRSALDLGLVYPAIVTTKHGMPPLTPWKMRMYAYLDRRATKLANIVIAVDSFTYRELRTKWKVKYNRLRLITNSAPVYRELSKEGISELKSRFGIDPSTIILLYTGRIEREKGVFELINAHQHISSLGIQISLWFVGDGSCRSELERLSRQYLAGSHIKFFGIQTDVEPFLAACDVVLLPSYQEGMPNSLLEAMASAKPVIATSVGGIPDLISNGINGILVPPRDPDSLVSAIIYLIENSEVAHEMGINGLKKSKNEFSLEKQAASFVNLYYELEKDLSIVSSDN